MTVNAGLEAVYRSHHQQRRGQGFVLLGEQRGRFFHDQVGQGKKVLDLGCRDGALTAYFSAGNEVWGLDIDQQALNIAAANLGIHVQQADLNGDWPVPANTFDVVVAAEVLEHLYYPDQVLQKIYNVLKPGGQLLGSVPHAFSLPNRGRLLLGRKTHTPLEDPTHINHFSAREFKALLTKNFTGVKLYPIISKKLKLLAPVCPLLAAYSFLFAGTKPD